MGSATGNITGSRPNSNMFSQDGAAAPRRGKRFPRFPSAGAQAPRFFFQRPSEKADPTNYP